MNCKRAQELLSPYLDGQLQQPEVQEVAAHLEACSGCREQLAGLRLASELVSSLPAPRLSVDLSAAVVARASVPRWRERWDVIRGFLAPRKALLVRQFGQAITIFALFVVAAMAPDSQVGRLVVSWPCQIAGVAGTGMAEITAGLSEAQALLDERAANSAFEQGTRR